MIATEKDYDYKTLNAKATDFDVELNLSIQSDWVIIGELITFIDSKKIYHCSILMRKFIVR